MPDATEQETLAAIAEYESWAKANTKGLLILSQGKVQSYLDQKLAGLVLKKDVFDAARKQFQQAQLEAKKPAKTLDSPLIELFDGKSGLQSMYRYDKKLFELVKGGTGYKPPQEQTIQKLMTVLAQCQHQEVLDGCLGNAMTVRQFLALTPDAQMRTIDALWDRCTLRARYDKATEAMYEPNNEVNLSKGQLPSTIRPDPAKTSGGVVKGFVRGPTFNPFTSLGVGFRVDGSGQDARTPVEPGRAPKDPRDSIARVLRDGMTAQILADGYMLGVAGKNLIGTAVKRGTKLGPRLNVAQRDLWNESGVCVARSFFGSTAFPERSSQCEAVMWAVDVTGLIGFDTEGWQMANPVAGAKQWRPGEKCYPAVTSNRMIGYVMITKLGDYNGGWAFRIKDDASWTFFGGNNRQREYVTADLDTYKGKTMEVPTEMDFQT